MTPRIVLFTRWPEPGQAKTRLIPVLGADAAAALHRKLTERVLGAMRDSGLPMEVRATGAPLSRFRGWLGEGLVLVDQGDGDLGARLLRAAAPPVILIGADIPDLSAACLQAARAALQNAPAVIGPAEDGGYYLLGLRTPMPFLFEAMPWGTDQVFTITAGRLADRGVVPALLPALADLDRPEDLARWPELMP
ncbi:MAG TPA: TIGR04282 family arsenosugar biosynthesis glycosyltransferase [Acetobacteraceae bacterium]